MHELSSLPLPTVRVQRDVQDLREVRDVRVPATSVDPDFAVRPHVWDAVRQWGTYLEEDDDYTLRERCSACSQQVMLLALPGGDLHYGSDNDREELRESLIFAHLVVRHGWTREQTGEQMGVSEHE